MSDLFHFLETEYFYMEPIFLLIRFVYFLENTTAPKGEILSQIQT